VGKLFSKEMRKALLEFLRNITPQVLFVTLTLISSVHLNFNQWDMTPAGWLRTAPFVICVVITIIAILANSFNFVDEAVDILEFTTTNKSSESECRRGGEEALGPDPSPAVATSKFGKFIGSLFIILLLEAGIIAPMAMGISGAINFISTTGAS
jgi:hypothetical protein